MSFDKGLSVLKFPWIYSLYNVYPKETRDVMKKNKWVEKVSERQYMTHYLEWKYLETGCWKNIYSMQIPD